MTNPRNHASIIMRTSNSNFSNANNGYPVNHIMHPSNSIRCPRGIQGIYTTDPGQGDCMYSDKARMTLLEMQVSKLEEQNKQKFEECRDWQQKYEALRQQQFAERTMIQHSACSSVLSVMDKRLANLEESVASVCSHSKEQKYILSQTASTYELLAEEIRARLGRMEETVASQNGWVETYNYENRDVCGEPEPGLHERGELRGDISHLYSRREPTSGNEIIMDNNIPADGDDRNASGSTVPEANNVVELPTDMTGNVYSSIYAEDLNGRSAGSQPSSVSASISMDRRPSDSTTSSNTNESGYCDDREEIFVNRDQEAGQDRYVSNAVYDAISDVEDDDVSQGNPGTQAESNNDGAITNGNTQSYIGTGTVIMTNHTSDECDDDIEVVGVIAQKKSGLGLQTSSVFQGQKTEGENDARHKQTPQKSGNRDRARRASVFSRASTDRPKPTALYGFDDEVNADTYSHEKLTLHAHEPMDPEISNLNDIFDTSVEVASAETAENPERSFLSIKRKRVSTSSEQPKRIRGITKAPVKQEPGTSSSIFRNESSQISPVNHSLVSPTLRPPPIPPPLPDQQFMETIRNIKKERVAHAVDDSFYDPLAPSARKCICGHKTNSVSGMTAHVKHKGTEEPRVKCPVEGCDARFLYPRLVKDHMEKVHQARMLPAKIYKCDKCYNVFFDKDLYDNHTNDRNENCKSTPRRDRRSQSVRAAVPSSSPQEEAYAPHGTETPKRPSIVITL